MQTVSLQEAQSRLPEIIAELSPGDEVVVTRDDRSIATIRASLACKHRQLGTLQGTILHIAPDFDAIPEGFEEYLE